jgi:cellulose synthase/poly-beta-1,6-N-acetylglucosamine synthase-like glycosyltransferase
VHTSAVQLIGDLTHLVLILALVLLCVLGAGLPWLMFQHVRRRKAALAEEERILSSPLPPDAGLPRVLVQIPAFNEGGLIRRVSAAVGNLDWPRDKLRIQILDDSTDGSTAEADDAVDALRKQGIDAALLHRASRAGFKAGALAAGLAQSTDEFVAIFDADYAPRADFLRACIRPMLLDPSLALVQARCDFANGAENELTAVQQRLLDAHFAVEQATRSWLGLVLPFNGTCGLWRKAAIEDAGGWEGDTLAEDLDLSYRVQTKGWKGRYLVSVTVPGELPTRFDTWRAQQFRWTKGFAQGARKLLPIVWRSGLALRQKIAASFHLIGVCMAGPLIGTAAAAGVVDVILGKGPTPLVGALVAFALTQGLGSLAVMLLLGQRMARNANMLSELRRLPRVLWLSQYVAFFNVRGTVEAFMGRASAFVRTPKRGAVAEAVADADARDTD